MKRWAVVYREGEQDEERCILCDDYDWAASVRCAMNMAAAGSTSIEHSVPLYTVVEVEVPDYAADIAKRDDLLREWKSVIEQDIRIASPNGWDVSAHQDRLARIDAILGGTA